MKFEWDSIFPQWFGYVAAVVIGIGTALVASFVLSIFRRRQEVLSKTERLSGIKSSLFLSFKSYFERLPVGVCVLRNCGRVCFVNSDARALLDKNQDVVLNAEAWSLFTLEDQKRIKAEFLAVRKTGKRCGAGLIPFPRVMSRSGAAIPVEVVLTALNVDKVMYYVLTLLDVSDRVYKEGHIRKTNQELEKKNVELEHFIYTISHDLKAPLATYSAILDMMKVDLEAGNTGKVIESIHRMEQLNIHVRELLEDVMNRSRTELDREQKPVFNLVTGTSTHSH